MVGEVVWGGVEVVGVGEGGCGWVDGEEEWLRGWGRGVVFFDSSLLLLIFFLLLPLVLHILTHVPCFLVIFLLMYTYLILCLSSHLPSVLSRRKSLIFAWISD